MLLLVPEMLQLGVMDLGLSLKLMELYNFLNLSLADLIKDFPSLQREIIIHFRHFTYQAGVAVFVFLQVRRLWAEALRFDFTCLYQLKESRTVQYSFTIFAISRMLTSAYTIMNLLFPQYQLVLPLQPHTCLAICFIFLLWPTNLHWVL